MSSKVLLFLTKNPQNIKFKMIWGQIKAANLQIFGIFSTILALKRTEPVS